jgi:biotin transport system substrate-specific component
VSARSDSSDVDARRVTTTALFAALLAASAAIAIPFGSVPVTMQVMVVVLIALVLSRRWAVFAVTVYLLAGALGLPVFSGMRGGLGVLLGPTGGYLFGFLLAAPAGAWVRATLRRGAISVTVADSVAAGAVILVVYSLGWLQLMLVTGMGSGAALAAGVAPFLIPDGLKAAAAVIMAPAVRRAAGV